MASRRRLSSVHALTLGGEAGQPPPPPAAAKAPARRASGRKSFGTAYTSSRGDADAAAAAAGAATNTAGIAAMYTTVIKMSTENVR